MASAASAAAASAGPAIRWYPSCRHIAWERAAAAMPWNESQLGVGGCGGISIPAVVRNRWRWIWVSAGVSRNISMNHAAHSGPAKPCHKTDKCPAWMTRMTGTDTPMASAGTPAAR